MTSTDTRGSGIDAPDDDVAAFAAAVRSHLDDLPPDEVEDLVDGLEADLAERREDSDEPLGDARAYADELRAAAGLPPRDARTGREWFGGARRLWDNGSAWIRRLRENPAVASVLDFLVALRPVWWVLRGWVACRMTVLMNLNGELPDTAPGWGVLAAFVVVSIQWGRGRWMPWTWLLALKRFVSVIVVIALPWLVGTATDALVTGAGTSVSYTTEEVAPEELSANGTRVMNVFAYDCAGNPLSGVQLFDQDGIPLAVGGDGEEGWIWGESDDGGDSFAIVPNPAANPGSGWNVFPLSHGEIPEDYGDVDRSTIEEPSPPFAAVQPLADAETTCAAGAGSDDEGQSTDPTDPSAPSDPTAPVEPSEP
jgi:hypothetical protein